MWGFLHVAWSLSSVLEALSWLCSLLLLLEMEELKIWNISFKRKLEVCDVELEYEEETTYREYKMHVSLPWREIFGKWIGAAVGASSFGAES